MNWTGTTTFSKASRTSSQQKPVTIFVMGLNQWRDEDDWPLARARNPQSTFCILREGQHSHQRQRQLCRLTLRTSEPPTRFVYDPSNPVPTTGGPLCCDVKHLAPGPRDQRPVEARRDVLVYSTRRFIARCRSHRAGQS